jgi:hypothetical protein
MTFKEYYKWCCKNKTYSILWMIGDLIYGHNNRT